ncbi:hypothetical protein A33O_08776 [Nitratireductor aquibiodomus RA22]|uniref:DUF4153 domain-containing protein n=1 Tax=Nitratireductor aquibiodomus RA22 TaxID=1189611 RepID=I5C0H5_9HYPH|nr:DUF4153 domain-containing protein [Nitratireductor aquibiodomus]EIM75327.1 hypothetical protein A33O_08776 [Nitratireductor aquibiodomus RA22]
MAEQLNDAHASTGWLASSREAIAAMGDALSRFPVTVIFLFLMALQANAMVADIDLAPVWIPDSVRDEDLLLALLAAVFASFAATLLAQAWRLSALIAALLALLAGVAAFTVMWPTMADRTVEWAFLASLMALVPIAPFAGRGSGNAFWMFTARLAFAAALGLLAFVLFGGGISAILASLTHLFGIDIPNDFYEHIWASIGLFVAPLFGLGQTPRVFDEEPGGHEHDMMQRGMRALGDFAAVPLLIIYAVILHLYVAKIIVTGEVPQGQIGWLVLTYGSCIVAVLLLTKPFLDTARAPTRFFVRFWPLFLLVPLFLLFYALSLRVDAFGWTVQRYFLGLFGLVMLVLVVLQLVPRARGDIRMIAGIPVLALLAGSFGPQGALDWSLSSQRERFLEIVRGEPEDLQTKAEALAVLRYLNGENAALDVAPDGFVQEDDESLYRQVAHAWGLDPDNPVQRGRQWYSYDRGSSVAVALEGFDVLLQHVKLDKEDGGSGPLSLPNGTRLKLVLNKNALSLEPETGTPTFFKIDTVRIVELSAQVDQSALLRLEADGKQIVLIPTYLFASSYPETVLTHFSGGVLLRSSDWE